MVLAGHRQEWAGPLPSLIVLDDIEPLKILSGLAPPPCCASRGQDSSQLPHALPRETCGRRPWSRQDSGTSWCQHESANEPAGWSGQQRPCCNADKYMASHLWEEYGKSGEGPQLGQSHRLWPKVKCPRLSMSNLPLPSKCSSEPSDPRSEPFGQSECHSGQDGSTRGSSEAEANCGGCSVSDEPWVFSSDHEKCWEPLAALPVHWPVLSHCKGRAGRSKLYSYTQAPSLARATKDWDKKIFLLGPWLPE